MNIQWRPRRAHSRRGRLGLPPIGFTLVAISLTTALILGGASRQNPWQVSIVEIASLPALLWAIWNICNDSAWRRHLGALFVLGVVIAIPLLQLLPLPPALWSQWPGHDAVAQGLRAAGLEIGWRSMSLTPSATMGHALALIAPAAVFLGVLQLSERHKGWLCGLTIIVAVASLLIGAAQLAGGADNPLYFYYPTNVGSAVGLFSNRNHQAALLVACLPLAALWIDIGRRSDRFRVLLIAAALAIFLITIIGLVIVKSRAGVFLLAPSLLISFMILLKSDTKNDRRFIAAIAGGATIVVLIGAVFGMGPLMERFADGLVDGRGATTATVLQASRDYLPLGSGIGSFVPVYSSVEPIDTMGRAFWNHAHNDIAELWLEAGVLFAAAFCLFAVWWLWSTIHAWRSPASVNANLARAGTTVTALLLIHSTVDYPLRTLALACVFAMACALMESKRAAPDVEAPNAGGGRR